MKQRTIALGLILFTAHSTHAFSLWTLTWKLVQAPFEAAADTIGYFCLGEPAYWEDAHWKNKQRKQESIEEKKNASSNIRNNPVGSIQVTGSDNGDSPGYNSGAPSLNSVQQPTSTATNSTPVDSKSAVNHTSPTNINININNNSSAQPEATKMIPQALQEALEDWYALSKKFVLENKYWIVGGGATVSYVFLYYNAYRGNRYLEQNNLWSSWYATMDIEELMMLDQTLITQELVTEIQCRYTQIQNSTDLLMPLAKFIHALDLEIVTLTFYQSFYQWMQVCCLSYVLPLHEATYGTIDARLERLEYLRKLFLIWSAHYKLELHKVALNSKKNNIANLLKTFRSSIP